MHSAKSLVAIALAVGTMQAALAGPAFARSGPSPFERRVLPVPSGATNALTTNGGAVTLTTGDTLTVSKNIVTTPSTAGAVGGSVSLKATTGGITTGTAGVITSTGGVGDGAGGAAGKGGEVLVYAVAGDVLRGRRRPVIPAEPGAA